MAGGALQFTVLIQNMPGQGGWIYKITVLNGEILVINERDRVIVRQVGGQISPSGHA
jgi:hypothetical protein